MKRAPRDQEPTQPRKWPRRSAHPGPHQGSHQGSHHVGNHGASPSPHYGARRAPHRPPRAITGIYSEASIAISEQQRAAAPTLRELRQRQSTLWDRAPAGCGFLNAAALKLFGATPGANINERNLPEEIKRLRRPTPLNTENSWIYRLAGGEILETNVAAALAVANGSTRPSNLLDAKSSALTDQRAVIARHVADFSEVENFYGTILTRVELDPHTFVVVPAAPPKTLRSEDTKLFRNEPVAPTIEVLNAVPMSKPKMEVEQAMHALCASLGEPAKRVWRASNPNYALPRIFIEPGNPKNAEQLARRLGQHRVQGRPLVTALNYAPELTQ